MHDLASYDFDLPPERIAQEPSAERDAARLLVLRRSSASRAHHVFRELPGLLRPGDLLVFNDTRVIPARLVGRRARTGGRWEGLFVRALAGGLWELLLQTRGRLVADETLLVEGPEEEASLRLVLVSKTPGGRWLVRPGQEGSPAEILARHGRVPIPPYIRKGRAGAVDRERYQTIYAQQPGAVAAPTAGLHFTPTLLEALAAAGIDRAFVTLHVGPGTFQPVTVEDIRQHRVEPEWGEFPAATAEALTATRARGGRVVAVGTTSVRLLESAVRGQSPEGQREAPAELWARDRQQEGPLAAWSGPTDLTIVLPFRFQAVDALITNFHLPRSSLLLLVSAFAGRENVLAAYQEAIARGYRFYSYGDAMLIE
jgi:S-adenosylmethionine:tRNA ribosyltransferase-isomerase